MNHPLTLILVGGCITGLFALMGILLTDYLSARRKRLEERTKQREALATTTVDVMRDALTAKDEEIRSWKDISEKRWEMAESWRRQAEFLRDRQFWR